MRIVASPDDNHSEMMRRLRLGDLRKLFWDRYGPTMPDDDAGREDLHELLLPISVGPHADIKMPNAIEVWAPWMQQEEADRLIDQVKRTPVWQRMPTARQLGDRLQLTNAERERLRLWTIAPYDLSPEQLVEQRKAKKRARMRRLRLLQNRQPRAEYEASSANHKKLWKLKGISRAAWYRDQRSQRETGVCQVKLLRAGHTPVSPEKARMPRKGLSEGCASLKAEFSNEGSDIGGVKGSAADATTARELLAHTCLTSQNRKSGPKNRGKS
jgi:hypothetical protein